MIRLQPLERLIDLFGCFLPGAAVELGHEEHLRAISIPQGFAHANLALPAVVIPGVVEEIDATVDGRPYQADAFSFVDVWLSDMKTAHSDRGDALAGAPQHAVRHVSLGTLCHRTLPD